MAEEQVLIAVDGGGSKTEFCVHHLRDQHNGLYWYGSTNYKNTGIEAATANLVQAFGEICQKENLGAEAIRGVVLGLSGFDSEEDIRIYQEMASALGIAKEKLFLCNDCELAFRAAANPPGVCTVAGTGSIAFGFDSQGKTMRCGGWGSLLSDDGSGYWIASRVLRQMLWYADGMGEYEPVFGALQKFYGIGEAREIPFVLTELDVAEIASGAKPIMDFAKEGDEGCRRIVKAAARKVARLTLSLYNRLDREAQQSASFVITGGLFRDELFLSTYTGEIQTIHPKEVSLLHIKDCTSENGIRLARRMFGSSL